MHLCSCINGRCGLIQNQHRRQTEHNARNTEQLFLPLGQTASVFCDHSIIALRQSFDKTVCMGGFCRCHDFLFCGIRFSHNDIVTNGARFQPGLLQHHAIGTAQTFSCHIPDIHAFYQNTALIHVIKTHQQIDNRGFSTAGGTNNSHPLSRFYRQVKILHQFCVRCIRKIHMRQNHISTRIFQCLYMGRLRYLRFFLDQFKNSCRTGKRILQFCHHAGNLIKRFCILIRITQETGQLANCKPPANNRKRSDQSNPRVRQTVYKPGRRIGQ